jgi:uncharacterized membrane protein
MLKYVVTYLGTAVVFAGVDFVWLSVLSAHVYRPTLDPVLADKVNLLPAVIFYLAYLAGMLGLVIAPAGRAGSFGQAAVNGAVLGAMAYATYDLTNQATLKVWSTAITAADIGWGTFLTGVGCSAGYLVWRWAQMRFG